MQKTVNTKLAFGVVGDFYDDSPRIVDPKIVSAGAIGLYYTIDTTNPSQANLGGEGTLGGIAVNSNEYALVGLEPSLDFVEGQVAQIASRGRVIVKSTTAVTVGQAGFYNTTTGVIASGTSGSSMAGFKEIPNSVFVEVNALANEVAVLQLG